MGEGSFWIVSLASLGLGVVAGFALADWVNRRIYMGMQRENVRLWSENFDLKCKLWEGNGK